MSKLRSKRPELLLVALALLGFVLRSWGLGGQPPSLDDARVVVSASNFVELGQLGPTMWNHPPLRNLLISGAVALFGVDGGAGVLSVKLPSLVLGSLAIPLLGVLGARLLDDRRAGLLAAALLALDPLHIDFSRQAVHEVYMATFSLAGLLATSEALRTGRSRWVWMAGLAFGLGLASKWYVGIAWILAIAISAHRTRRADYVVVLLLTPLSVYLAIWYPWFLRGFTLGEWLHLQGLMATESAVHRGYNATSLAWAAHPLWWFLRPVPFVDFFMVGTRRFVLMGFGNPLVWMATLPAMLLFSRDAWRTRSPWRGVVAMAFWLAYLPLVCGARPLWVHTAFSVLPFALLAVSDLAVRLWRDKPTWRRGLVAYGVLVLVLTVPLYLLATGPATDMPLLQPILDLYRPHGGHP